MRRTAGMFVMGGRGHVQRMARIAESLVQDGAEVVFFTDPSYATEVAATGACFEDLFAVRPVSAVDDESRPPGSRNVTFAGACADEVIALAAPHHLDVVLSDSFAVIGRVVAAGLGVPWVQVCAGHNVQGALIVPQLAADPRLHLAPACHRAVEVLHDRFGIDDATPFSYVGATSPTLNICCEPPQMLRDDDRRAFEPVVFFGSLPSATALEPRRVREGAPGAVPDPLRVYVSFGTVVWAKIPEDPRFSTAVEALAAFRSISDALGQRSDVQALISLGGSVHDADTVASLRRPNVDVEAYVDQWQVLAGSDAFITHHGLNSTHEAIHHEVPMIAYPFIVDQPIMATRCEELGLSAPLVPTLRAEVTRAHVDAAIDDLRHAWPARLAALSEARRWEDEVIAARPAVVERIMSLG